MGMLNLIVPTRIMHSYHSYVTYVTGVGIYSCQICNLKRLLWKIN